MKKWFFKKVKSLLLFLLDDKQVQKRISTLLLEAIRKGHLENSHNLHNAMHNIASMETAKFILANIPLELNFENRLSLLEEAFNHIPKEGLVLEFGVYKGESINYIADHLKDRKIYGFDSFEGLSEPWHFSKKGLFKVKNLPKVRENVVLIKGFFDQTLPGFLKKEKSNCALIHIDSDLYSSAKTIFTHLEGRIVEGTVIVFDEFFNFPNWHQHEFKAFMEFMDEENLKCEYLGYTYKRENNNRSGHQVVLKIKK